MDKKGKTRVVVLLGDGDNGGAFDARDWWGQRTVSQWRLIGQSGVESKSQLR